MSAVQHTPGPTPADFDPANPIYYARNGSPLHPMCRDCGWRMGGVDSWDGTRCKCGRLSPSFPQHALRWLAGEAAAHEAAAERLNALDSDGACEVAASYHATRASEYRAAIAKATGSAA